MSDAPKRRLRRGAVAAATTAELADLGVDPAASALAVRAAAPPKERGDKIDQLAERRAQRLSPPAAKDAP